MINVGSWRQYFGMSSMIKPIDRKKWPINMAVQQDSREQTNGCKPSDAPTVMMSESEYT